MIGLIEDVVQGQIEHLDVITEDEENIAYMTVWRRGLEVAC